MFIKGLARCQKIYFFKSPQKNAEKHLFFPREFPRDLDMSTKIRYELESKTNQKGESLIHLIMSYGFKEYDPKAKKDKYQSLKISTQQSIRKEDWNGDAPTRKYTASKGKTLQTRLAKLAQECEHQLDLYFNEHNEVPHPKVLKGLIEEKLNRKQKVDSDIRIIDHIDSIIEANSKLPLTANGRIGDKQVDKYRTVRNMLLAYEEGRKVQLTVSKFTEEQYYDLWNFTNDAFKASSKNEHGYLASTMAKNATTLRSLLKKGDFDKSKIGLNLNDKKLLLKEVEARDSEVYLSEKHLKKIIEADTLRSKEFENARNYLILCSFTSLRYGDMAELHDITTENFEANGIEFEGFITKVRKGAKATEKVEVCIPVFKPVADLLKANNGRFPKFPTNQKMNEQIKKFAKHLGLDEPREIENWYYNQGEPVIEKVPLYSLMKCHLGRGTFISNLMNLGLEESDFDFITHPDKKTTMIKRHYDKRTLVEKAAKLVNKLSSKEISRTQYQI